MDAAKRWVSAVDWTELGKQVRPHVVQAGGVLANGLIRHAVSAVIVAKEQGRARRERAQAQSEFEENEE